MRVHGYDMVRIVIAFLVVLAVIIAGQRLWLVHGIQRPFCDEITSVQGVIDCDVATADVIKVYVADVDDLQATVMELERIGQRYRPEACVQIIDQRSDKLSQAFTIVRFHLEEAIATGYFTPMLDRVAELLDDEDINWWLSIDTERLYVTMRSGEASLYEVVVRQSPNVPAGVGS